MASLIAVLLFAILFHTDVHCITRSDFADSIRSGLDLFTSNFSNAGLDLLNPVDQKVVHGPKINIPALIEIIPEESNGTDIPVARNDSSVESDVSVWLNISQLNETTEIAWLNIAEHNKSIAHYGDDLSTESRFDEWGCDTYLRDKHEDDCFENFRNAIEEFDHIEDEVEKGKHLCCASEGYERCCVNGYEAANCKADHDAIKQNLKAARMFMATMSDISCAIHRGKCGFNSVAALSPLSAFLLVALGFLPIAALL